MNVLILWHTDELPGGGEDSKLLAKPPWCLGVDGQRILSPSNQVTLSTTWLAK